MSDHPTNHVFLPEAKQRLEAIHPGDGAVRYDRLEAFAQAAARRPGQRLLVPPDVDDDLHQVLSARINGRGLERVGVTHLLLTHVLVNPGDPDHEDTIGRAWSELTSPLALQTRTALAQDGVEIDPNARYVQPACYCIFGLANAA